MVELPEAVTIAGQLTKTVVGRRIVSVQAAHTPHKFAWYHGDPKGYPSLLKGKKIRGAGSAGTFIEFLAGDAAVVLGDGVGLTYHADDRQLPAKHQLLVTLDNSTYLSATIQMYGGIFCFKAGAWDNKYLALAKKLPSPLSPGFTRKYFEGLVSAADVQKLSSKAFLATDQRVPGLGNGVLQDILFAARIHPRRKVASLSGPERDALYRSVKDVLKDMTAKGGRDTEKDLFGNAGGYTTRFCKNTAGGPCPGCGTPITKENYLGGSVYYCGKCQMLR